MAASTRALGLALAARHMSFDQRDSVLACAPAVAVPTVSARTPWKSQFPDRPRWLCTKSDLDWLWREP